MYSNYFDDSPPLNEVGELLLPVTQYLSQPEADLPLNMGFQEELSQHPAFDVEDVDSDKILSSGEEGVAQQKTNFCRRLISEISTVISDGSGDIRHVYRGLSTVIIVGVILGVVLPHNVRLNGVWYQYVSSIIGYTYFTAWSISFYPQLFLNCRRKDTEGIHNVLGVGDADF